MPRDGVPQRLVPLLTAPLLVPTAGWSSRTLAELTGHSQAAVARAWRAAYPVAGHPAAAALPAAGLRLEAAAVHAGNSVLVLTAGTGPQTTFTGRVMRSPRRRPLQALLAADLLAADRAGGRGGPAADRALVERVVRPDGARAAVLVLTRRPLGAPGATEVVVPDAAGWQALLADLVRRCTRSPAADLVAAQNLVMEWARSDRPRFAWTAHPAAARPAGSAVPGRAPGTPPRPAGRALADDVLAVLLDLLGSGRLAGGDRVTEAPLARAAHASRSQVREALRTLASDALLDVGPDGAAVVPVPQQADVVETYAARRALGTLVVRRACHLPPAALDPAARALRHLLDTAATGDAFATGEADLRFQDALAACTGMRRVPPLFAVLTAQVRLFTAVMGLDYTYSIAGMCRDDTALLEHVRARDEAGAVRAWNRKIDDAATYMTTQLTLFAARPATRRRVPRPAGTAPRR